MGFVEADPRQFASIVGKTQVGITISAAPSTIVGNSTTSYALDVSTIRVESDLFGSLDFVVHLPILQSAFADLRARVDLTFGGYQIYVNRWGILCLTDRAQSPASLAATS